MTIEYIAVYRMDIDKGKGFFAKYFDGIANQKYMNRSTGFTSYCISFSDGSRLELMNGALTVGKNGRNQVGYTHVAFGVGTKEKVTALTNRIRADGYRIERAENNRRRLL